MSIELDCSDIVEIFKTHLKISQLDLERFPVQMTLCLVKL